MIFMGKRGEHADLNSLFLGSNLEKVARSIQKRLFITSFVVPPIKRFLIAYDGKDSVRKAIDYISKQSLLKKGIEFHLLAVERAKDNIQTSEVEQILQHPGFTSLIKTEQNSHPDQAI
jgi:hypothetical protein